MSSIASLDLNEHPKIPLRSKYGGRLWPNRGLTLGIIVQSIPLGSMMGKVEELFEFDPVIVVERVVIRSDGPPWTAKNWYRVGL